MSQSVKVMMIVVVVLKVRMCIVVEPSLHWSRCWTHIPKTKKSLVCDSGPSSSPTYTITDYLSTGYCPKGNVNDFDLRRSFYSKQEF